MCGLFKLNCGCGCGCDVFVFLYGSLSGDGQEKPLGTAIRNAQVDMDMKNPLGMAIRNAQVGKKNRYGNGKSLGTAIRNAQWIGK